MQLSENCRDQHDKCDGIQPVPLAERLNTCRTAFGATHCRVPTPKSSRSLSANERAGARESSPKGAWLGSQASMLSEFAASASIYYTDRRSRGWASRCIVWLGGVIFHGELNGEYVRVLQAVGVPKANVTKKFNNPGVRSAASRRGRRP